MHGTPVQTIYASLLELSAPFAACDCPFVYGASVEVKAHQAYNYSFTFAFCSLKPHDLTVATVKADIQKAVNSFSRQTADKKKNRTLLLYSCNTLSREGELRD